MAAPKRLFRCSNCNYDQAKWFGVCPECKERNTSEEVSIEPERQGKKSADSFASAKLIRLSDVEKINHNRDSTGIEELDRVLGGGLVKGSYLILVGEPGAGKTTLASELVINMDNEGKKVAYFSGEESPEQLKMRFERLGNLKADPQFQLSDTVSAESVVKTIKESDFDLVVIDSIQTMMSEQLTGAQGSLSQVRECGSMLMRAAKSSKTTVLLTGQVIKSGEIAGPRTLEHMVDAVLTFEGDRREQYRILRAHKNRFGSTEEIGVFEMKEDGLKGVSDPTKLFVADSTGDMPGAALTVLIEGSRPVLAEIQALANASDMPNPTRAVRGIDQKRVQMLLAVLQRHCRVRTANYEIYVNVSGGLKIDDPGTDLAICLAVVAAIERRPVIDKTVSFGEVTLLGACRPAAQHERRGKESDRLGYKPLAGNGELRDIIDSALGQPIGDDN